MEGKTFINRPDHGTSECLHICLTLVDEPGKMVRSSSPGLELRVFGKASVRLHGQKNSYLSVLPSQSTSRLTWWDSWMELLQPGASLIGREPLVNRDGVGIAPLLSDYHLLLLVLSVAHALGQALLHRHRQLDPGHVQPRAVPGRVVNFQPA